MTLCQRDKPRSKRVEVKLGPSRDLVNGEIRNPGHYRAVVHAHK